MGDLSRIDELRIAALQAAAVRGDLDGTQAVITAARQFLTQWLMVPAAQIILGTPLVADQGTPDQRSPLRKAPGMAATMNDGQIATYPAATAADAKGAPVTGAVVLTTDDDTAQLVVSRVDNPDGSTTLTAKDPGVVTLTWTSGTDTLVDTLNVIAGAAVQIEVGAPVITDQA